MEKVLLKKLNILEIILILSPIIDILTSITQRTFNIDISLGLIIRSFLLFFMSMFMLVKSKYKYKKITIAYFCSILIYFAIFIVSTYLNKGNEFILSETKELIKVFYFPICLIAVLNYLETEDNKINLKILFIVILEYIVLLFIPSVLNTGYESYAEDKVGTIGWFYSANEISAIYSILIVILIFSYSYIKNLAIYLIIIGLSLYTILQIGTKLPAATAIISIVGYSLIGLLQYMITKEKKHLKIFGVGILVSFIFVPIFIYSPVLKNFDIYKNYLINTRETNAVETKIMVDETESIQNAEKNDIQNIETKDEQIILEKEQEKTEDETLESVENINCQDNGTQKEEEVKLTEDEIATIIHSGRAATKKEVQNAFNELTNINKLIGLGYRNSNNSFYYLIEIDYYDILYNYGYLGFVIYFLPVIGMLILILKGIFSRKIKMLILDERKCCFILIIINGLICAIAGHTFVAPAVSIYIAIALIQLYREYE